jgi:hypothetical protein
MISVIPLRFMKENDSRPVQITCKSSQMMYEFTGNSPIFQVNFINAVLFSQPQDHVCI